MNVTVSNCTGDNKFVVEAAKQKMTGYCNAIF